MAISKKKQALLRTDELTVRNLYTLAVARFGQEAVDKDLTRLWDMRCILGMSRALPFGSTEFQNLGELLWIAKEVCGYADSRGANRVAKDAAEPAPGREHQPV